MLNLFRRDVKTASPAGGAPLVALSSPGAATWTRDPALLAREGYERNAIGYRCVRLVAETAASLPFRALNTQGEAVLALLEQPNPLEAGADLIETFYGHLLISGETFLEAVRLDREVRELHVLAPSRVKALPGPRGWPAGWEVRERSGVRRVLREADGFLPVMQMRLFHPGDPLSGHAPLEAAARAVDIHNGGGAWAKALIDNSARPSGALVYRAGERMNDAEFERLKQELERGHAGAAHAGRPMVLEGGLDWKPMSLSPADMDFIEARHAAAREIALAFGVPPMLLGIPGDATFANYREANSAFWRHTVLPLAMKAGRALSRWLGGAPGDLEGARIAPDTEQAPAFQEDRAALWSRLEAASFLSVAEKRRLAGLDADLPPDAEARP